MAFHMVRDSLWHPMKLIVPLQCLLNLSNMYTLVELETLPCVMLLVPAGRCAYSEEGNGKWWDKCEESTLNTLWWQRINKSIESRGHLPTRYFPNFFPVTHILCNQLNSKTAIADI